MTEAPDNLIVEARGLHKTLGAGPSRVHVLRGLDLSVRRGEFLAIMGPSGCGKSTLLHVLGLMTPLDEPAEGRPAGSLRLDGQEAPASSGGRTRVRRTRIGFVFQRFNLIPVLSALDNVKISLKVRGAAADGRIGELFERMGVADVANRRPGQMSIGQQQRVAVVRALAHRPALLLADEPTGNLDSASAAGLLETFQQVHRQDGQTIVMITHSPEAARYADRTVWMNDGRIIETP